MGKIIRLTESDLVRLVKRIIKENEFENDESNMNSDCDEIIDNMRYVYRDIMRHYKSKPEKFDAEEMYNDLESELGGLLDMAYDNDCENIQEVELMYDDLLKMFLMKTGFED